MQVPDDARNTCFVFCSVQQIALNNLSTNQEYLFENNHKQIFEKNEWTEVAVWKQSSLDVLPGKLLDVE